MLAVVWDTEFTTWEGAQDRCWSGENEYRELVRLAAKKIDLETEEIIETIDIIVKPVKNPEVSSFFTKLTKITQKQIDQDGIRFQDAYNKFKDFAKGVPCFSYGMDCVILQEGCDINNIKYDLNTLFIDASVYFKNHGIDVRNYTSGTISTAFDIKLEGHVHCAMHDVNSLTTALLELKKQKDILV